MGFLERRKRKKKYSNKVCPDCGTPLSSMIYQDFEFGDILKNVNIGGKLIHREVLPLNFKIVGEIKGFECEQGHKWTDSFQVTSVFIECPRTQCDRFLEYEEKDGGNEFSLKCENLKEGCYVEITIGTSSWTRNFKKFKEKMNEEIAKVAWDMEFYTSLSSSFPWYHHIEIPIDRESARIGKEPGTKDWGGNTEVWD